MAENFSDIPYNGARYPFSECCKSHLDLFYGVMKCSAQNFTCILWNGQRHSEHSVHHLFFKPFPKRVQYISDYKVGEKDKTLREKAPRYLGPEFPAKANTPQYGQLLYHSLEVLFVGFFLSVVQQQVDVGMFALGSFSERECHLTASFSCQSLASLSRELPSIQEYACLSFHLLCSPFSAGILWLLKLALRTRTLKITFSPPHQLLNLTIVPFSTSIPLLNLK